MRSPRFRSRLTDAPRVFSAVAAAATALSHGRTAEICAEAAAAAASQMDVPREWLQAISLVESGRGQGDKRHAWPWTVNDHGEGIWFESKRDAIRYVERRLASGRRLVDVGCFQINWRWHGREFDSVAAAFEPFANARYAANFLRTLYQETGSWPKAVGRYHSGTLALAEPYLAKVARVRSAAPNAAIVAARQIAPAAVGGVRLVALRGSRPLLRQASRRMFDPGDRAAVPLTPRARLAE